MSILNEAWRALQEEDEEFTQLPAPWNQYFDLYTRADKDAYMNAAECGEEEAQMNFDLMKDFEDSQGIHAVGLIWSKPEYRNVGSEMDGCVFAEDGTVNIRIGDTGEWNVEPADFSEFDERMTESKKVNSYDRLRAIADSTEVKESCKDGVCNEAEEFTPISTTDEYYPIDDKKDLHEDVESSIPAHALPENEIIDFVMAIEPARAGHPLRTFKLGYISELTKEIASKYKADGRGHINRETGEIYDVVRIFKCTEYSALETATNPRTTRMGLAADKALGSERHTGEKTGFGYEADEYAFRIGQYQDGSKALQACINANSKQRVKYFLSLNDEDLREVTREEVAQYLTPAEAAKLTAPRVREAAGKDAAGNDVFDKPINRFKLSKIYMIGHLGHSIM